MSYRCAETNFLVGLFPLFILLLPASVRANGDLDAKGRLMIDYSTYDGVHNEGVNGRQAYIRRARIGLDHDSERGWQAELEVDYDSSSGEIDLKDAKVEFDINQNLAITVGHFKENFSLENTTSSNDIQTLERSTATETFSPGRNFGMSLEGDFRHWYWQFGVFQATVDDNETAHSAITGRSALQLFSSPNGLVHIGVSASQRQMGGQEYEVNEPIAIPEGDKVIESKAYSVNKIQSMAIEGAWVYRRFSLQTEYFAQQIEPEITQGLENPIFDGYYITTSWFLTDHTRQYKNGAFEGFSPHGDERGIEIVARFSEIDLRDQQEGVFANSQLLALNYYLSESVKVLAEYSISEVESPNPDETGDGKAFTVRVSYKF